MEWSEAMAGKMRVHVKRDGDRERNRKISKADQGASWSSREGGWGDFSARAPFA